ncbi:phosphotransferase enzyme family protein [Ideonella sp.]|uniref:phosphotransferase enzyme family protein n=1 Tax=Ideonella sp. TaxID=1929293 RepID=UPI002B477A72|nr:phosphotransferase [Ideonella sp.]HJV71703.1 phosphotransferase [Ideonella sp.]
MRERRECEDTPAVLQQLAESALRSWHTAVREIRLIKMRENAVFRVVDSQGDAFALRVHHEGNHDDDALRSELQWMSALKEDGVDVPTIVPAADGRLFVSVPMDGVRGVRQVDLLRWIDGRQLGTSASGLSVDLADVEQTYRLIGNTAARLHNHATAWSPPQTFRRHHWDLEGLAGEQPLWGRFWDLEVLTSAERELLLHARNEVRRQLCALARRSDSRRRYSLIHADLVPENLLLLSNGTVRLIDFDDCGFGWHLLELATALYFIQDDPSYEVAKAGLVAGYREYRDLPDVVLADLPTFMAARAFTYLGWVHTRPESKDGQAITPHLVRLARRQAENLLCRHKSGVEESSAVLR